MVTWLPRSSPVTLAQSCPQARGTGEGTRVQGGWLSRSRSQGGRRQRQAGTPALSPLCSRERAAPGQRPRPASRSPQPAASTPPRPTLRGGGGRCRGRRDPRGSQGRPGRRGAWGTHPGRHRFASPVTVPRHSDRLRPDSNSLRAPGADSLAPVGTHVALSEGGQSITATLSHGGPQSATNPSGQPQEAALPSVAAREGQPLTFTPVPAGRGFGIAAPASRQVEGLLSARPRRQVPPRGPGRPAVPSAAHCSPRGQSPPPCPPRATSVASTLTGHSGRGVGSGAAQGPPAARAPPL